MQRFAIICIKTQFLEALLDAVEWPQQIKKTV